MLATPAEHGTILALHHPPIPSPMVPVAEVIELLETDRLAGVIEGSDVRAILGGHYHFPSHSTFAGIPVSVAAATCYLADPAPLDRFISAVDGNTSVNAVHVYADRVVHTIVPGARRPPRSSGFGPGRRAAGRGAQPGGAARHDQPRGLRLQPGHARLTIARRSPPQVRLA